MMKRMIVLAKLNDYSHILEPCGKLEQPRHRGEVQNLIRWIGAWTLHLFAFCHSVQHRARFRPAMHRQRDNNEYESTPVCGDVLQTKCSMSSKRHSVPQC